MLRDLCFEYPAALMKSLNLYSMITACMSIECFSREFEVLSNSFQNVFKLEAFVPSMFPCISLEIGWSKEIC